MGNVHGGATDAELGFCTSWPTAMIALRVLVARWSGSSRRRTRTAAKAGTRQSLLQFDIDRGSRAARDKHKLELLHKYPRAVCRRTRWAATAVLPARCRPATRSRHVDGLAGQPLRWRARRRVRPPAFEYFTSKVFDFFAMVYGDIVPATGFGEAATRPEGQAGRSPSGPTSTTSPTGSRSPRPRC